MQPREKEQSIHYETIGNGMPILFIHGFGVDHHLFKMNLEPFFSENNLPFKRIYLDLPGMGKTPVQKSVKNADQLLLVLLDFIQEVIGEQPFILCGNSYGGYLSLGISHQLTQQVVGTFLICPVTISDRKKRTLPEKPSVKWRTFSVIEHQKYFPDFLAMASKVTPDTWSHFKREIIPGIQTANSNFLTNFQERGYCLSNEKELLTHNLEIPLYILLGKQDQVVGYFDALPLLINNQHCTFSVLDFAGHNLQIDQTAWFHQHFKNFLQKYSNE